MYRTIVFLLLVSLVLHVIQPEHHHPHELFGDGLHSYFHGEDKKLWLVVIFLTVLFFLQNIFRTKLAETDYSWSKEGFLSFQNISPRFFNYFQVLFASGILNPKPFQRLFQERFNY